ncbi:flagellin [Pelagovum pacificum]|uniref:Flagellin C-terminal domain-containing protein n=1 Tax=Pelagovum pacificum TaxID=2588711 RepID=A0A5C5GL71_9RHOB|nr:flagellin [Pelagovum pacificum]QQA42723.1 hypothetical protein I8N54_18435 [Pelagovum pacificum]TNY34126.1 hypothetical protein FHY64_12945 [Pelagovum pacificum]
MTTIGTGDLGAHFLASRRISSVKTRLNTLSHELGSGRVADIGRRLRGDTAQVAQVDHRIDLTTSHITANTETATMLSQMQLTVSNLGERRTALTQELLSLPDNPSAALREGAISAARTTFFTSVGDLNFQVGGRALFSGDATGTPSLAAPGDMLSNLATSLSAATDIDDLTARLDAWFDDPSGGFATMGYRGSSTGYQSRPLGDGTTTEIDVTANDDAIRGYLKSTALIAVLPDISPALSEDMIKDALKIGLDGMITSSQPLSLLQGRIGRMEALVDGATARLAAERTSLSIVRNDLTSADPYETASSLQAVELQLEMNYSVTARLSRLSLMEYLR